MKLIVQEYVSRIAEPHKKVFSITADAIGSYNTIPLSIGLSKGDLIAFRGEGDPIRISSGGVDGRVLVVDSSTESGWKVAPMSGSDTAVTLHNGTGTIVPGGTVVKISSGDELALATSSDTSMLFVTSEDCNDDADVVCYGTTNTICSVRCTSGAVAIGDKLKVSSTNGVAEATQGDGFAQALTAKASGSTGTVTAIFVQSGFLPFTGGTMSGSIVLASNKGFETPVEGGYYTTNYGNFRHNSSTPTNSWNIVSYDGTNVFQVMFETGEIKLGQWKATTIDIAHGGTGATTASAAWTALGGGSIGKKNSLAASDIPAHSTDKLTSGTLPVARGGTGATSLQAVRNAMGLGNTTGALPIANGGTGATTRLNALKALTNESVGTSANFFLTITSGWGKGGYTNVADAKTVLGITDSGWKTLESTYGTVYRKERDIVTVIFSTSSTFNLGETVLGTLPSGYRAKNPFYVITDTNYSRLMFETSGVVRMISQGNTGRPTRVCATFIAA